MVVLGLTSGFMWCRIRKAIEYSANGSKIQYVATGMTMQYGMEAKFIFILSTLPMLTIFRSSVLPGYPGSDRVTKKIEERQAFGRGNLHLFILNILFFGIKIIWNEEHHISFQIIILNALTYTLYIYCANQLKFLYQPPSTLCSHQHQQVTRQSKRHSP